MSPLMVCDAPDVKLKMTLQGSRLAFCSGGLCAARDWRLNHRDTESTESVTEVGFRVVIGNPTIFWIENLAYYSEPHFIFLCVSLCELCASVVMPI